MEEYDQQKKNEEKNVIVREFEGHGGRGEGEEEELEAWGGNPNNNKIIEEIINICRLRERIEDLIYIYMVILVWTIYTHSDQRCM